MQTRLFVIKRRTNDCYLLFMYLCFVDCFIVVRVKKKSQNDWFLILWHLVLTIYLIPVGLVLKTNFCTSRDMCDTGCRSSIEFWVFVSCRKYGFYLFFTLYFLFHSLFENITAYSVSMCILMVVVSFPNWKTGTMRSMGNKLQIGITWCSNVH